MKKLLIALGILFFCGANINAQNYVKITDVSYLPTVNRIQVVVEFTTEGNNNCSSVDFKVIPANNVIATLLNDGVKYGKVIAHQNPSVTVEFGCGQKDKEKAEQCRLYDFNVVTTDYKPK